VQPPLVARLPQRLVCAPLYSSPAPRTLLCEADFHVGIGALKASYVAPLTPCCRRQSPLPGKYGALRREQRLRSMDTVRERLPGRLRLFSSVPIPCDGT